jgi:hypothetical protein
MRALTAALWLRRAAQQGAAGAPAPATADGSGRVLLPIGFDPTAAGGRPAGPIPATRLAARRHGYGGSAWIGAAAETIPEGDRMPRRESARWSR